MKRQTTQAPNNNSQDTPMKNIYSKRKLSVLYTQKSENSRKRYVHYLYDLSKESFQDIMHVQ